MREITLEETDFTVYRKKTRRREETQNTSLWHDEKPQNWIRSSEEAWKTQHQNKTLKGSNIEKKRMFKGVHEDAGSFKGLMCRVLCLLLLLMVVHKGWRVRGVQVMEFQKDGVASWWTVAEYKMKLDRNRKMDSVTLCGRFKLFFLHARGTFFHLQDLPSNLDSQLKGELWLDRVRPVIAHRWNFQPLENKLRTYR